MLFSFIFTQLMSVLAIEQICHYLCNDYVDAAIEFVQAYIQILEAIHREGQPQLPRNAATAR